MKILITGSNGLLGQNLVSLLNGQNLDFLATSKGENRNPDLSNNRYKSMDITDKKSVENVVSSYIPTAIIHTAAMTNVDLCESEKAQCMLLNVEAIKNLLSVCKTYNIHFVHTSTDFIFDGEKGDYKENDTPNPLSFYGQSKLDSEQLVKSSNLENWSIARTIILYDKLPNMSRSNIVIWAIEALENGQNLNIVSDQFRSPTHGQDLAKGCLEIVKRKVGGIYHLSGGETMSIFELVKRVARFFDLDETLIKPIKTNQLNQKAKRPLKTGFCLDKARRDLDYSPMNFEAGLTIIKDRLTKN